MENKGQWKRIHEMVGKRSYEWGREGKRMEGKMGSKGQWKRTDEMVKKGSTVGEKVRKGEWGERWEIRGIEREYMRWLRGEAMRKARVKKGKECPWQSKRQLEGGH